MNSDQSFKYQYFKILNLRVNISTVSNSSAVIEQLIRNSRASYVCLVNVHLLVSSMRDKRLYLALNNSNWNFPDGMPIVWYAKKIIKFQMIERVAGITLMEKCFDKLYDVKHFFYGSTENKLNKVVSIAKRSYPTINIVGSYSPPFRMLTNNEKKEIISLFNRISPDIIWIALGAPKQELFMREIASELKSGVMIGVGAAFDYFIGDITRSPLWLRRLGLEWLCRLCTEPARLIKRYLITNSLFIVHVLKEIISGRHSSRKGL